MPQERDSHVFWVEGQPIAIGPCPMGGKNLLAQCREYRFLGVDMVVSAQTMSEAESLGLDEEEAMCAEAGMSFLRIPVKDHSAPPYSKDIFAAIDEIVEATNAGKRVFIHCFAGIGRSASIAAAVLVRQGMTGKAAIEALRKARGLIVPETNAQIRWILDYESRHNK